MGSPLVSPPVAKPKALNCPSCGAAVEIRGFAHTLSVVCPNCLTVLDATTPELQILQKFHAKQRGTPKIPLGSRGKFGGAQYEVIGYQVRQVVVDDDFFVWDEYLLFNPYQGFRYLTEYQGHWNFVRVLASVPQSMSAQGRKPRVTVEGRNFVHFDHLVAKTTFVLGEFPWQVHVGDSVACDDYIAPPYMLSSEKTQGEVTWSEATYTRGDEIYRAFSLRESPPPASGIFANQPSPYGGSVRSAWRVWLWLNVALFAIMFAFTIGASNREVFHQSYAFAPGGREAAYVTPTFDLGGRDSNVELDIRTDLNNSWAYFNFALINEETGTAHDFGREVSYYRDSDGSEGSPSNDVVVPGVPSGRYYLRVEPEMDPKGRLMHYELTVRRDVPRYNYFFWAALLLLIPPILKFFRSAGFESARWRESDYGSAISSSGGDD